MFGIKRGALISLIAIAAIIFAAIPSLCGLSVSVDISEVGTGARPMALGGAYLAVADDASAVFTNPAGLGYQNKLSFISMTTQLMSFVDYQVAAVSYPTQWGTFGFGYIGATAPAGNYIYIDGGGITHEGGSMSYSNQMYVLSYGTDASEYANEMFYLDGDQKLSNLTAGANLKYLTQGFSGSMRNAPAASGLALDLGAQYRLNKAWAFGATLANIVGSYGWDTGEKEVLPSMLKLGASYQVLDNVKLAVDSDTSLSGIRGTVGRFGAEWQAIQYLSLRAGIGQKIVSIAEDTAGVIGEYTLGAGFNYESYRFDYAYKVSNDFSEFTSHYFSFCYTGEEIAIKKTTGADVLADSSYEKLFQGSTAEEVQGEEE